MALYLWGVAEVLGLFVSSKSLVSTITAEQIFHKTSFLSAGVPVWYLQGIDILLCLFYSVSPGLLLVFLLAMINAMIFRIISSAMDLFSATRNVKNYIQCLNSNSTRYKEISPQTACKRRRRRDLISGYIQKRHLKDVPKSIQQN